MLSDKWVKYENNKKLKIFVVLNKYEATTQKFLWDIKSSSEKKVNSFKDLHQKISKTWAWCHIPLILAFSRQQQVII